MKVADAFNGQHLLLTGVTGFVGQAVLAKFLQVVRDAAQVYVLIRGKGDITAQQRFDDLVASSRMLGSSSEDSGVSNAELAELLRTKVTVVQGDLAAERGDGPPLGMSDSDFAMLCEKITMIIHSAADVGFTNPFAVALRANLLGTVAMQAFAHQCPKLNTFVYVSTAYVGSNSKESIMTPTAVALPFDVSSLVRAVEAGDEEQLSRYEHFMLGCGWPNTYVMSKVCAEGYLHQYQGDLPTLVVRPSMIGCSYWDEVGWNLSKGGPTLSTFAIGMGAITVLSNSRHSLDIVPVDYLANLIITSTTYFSQLPAEQRKRIHIHHGVMGLHRLQQKQYFATVVDHYRSSPLPGRMRTPRTKLCVDDNHLKLELMARYKIPLSAIEMAASVWPGLLKIKPVKQLKVALSKTLQLFDISMWVIQREFAFVAGDELHAMNQLSDPRERRLLHRDLADLDHDTYVRVFCDSIRSLMLPNKSRAQSKL